MVGPKQSTTPVMIQQPEHKLCVEKPRRQLDNIHRERDFMEPNIQALLLHKSPEAHAAHPVSTTRNWIATPHQTLFQNSARRVKSRRALLGMRSISLYFSQVMGDDVIATGTVRDGYY